MNNTGEALIDYGVIFFPIRTQVISSYHSFNITQILIFIYNTIIQWQINNMNIDISFVNLW